MKNQCKDCKKGFNSPTCKETTCFNKENQYFLKTVVKACDCFEKRSYKR